MTQYDTERRSTDIVIIGAGPVGMAVAATTARYGMKVTLIECSSGTTPYSKAIGVHAITLEKMHTLGLSEALLAEGFPMRDYALYDGGRRTMATSFAGLPTPYDFVLGLPQSRTEAHLAADLEALGVEILWEHRLTEIREIGRLGTGGPLAEVAVETPDGRRLDITADYVVGADGGRSATREALGIGFPGGSYGKAFLLGDVRLDWDGPRHELQFHLSRHGYLLLIPMPDGMHRVIAQTDLTWEDFQDRANRPEAKLEMLQAIIDQRGPGGITAYDPQWLTAAPFYYRLAEQAHKGRVFLAGDALHLVSPLGAQGLNTGFGDAFNLGWKLGHVFQGLADHSLLESYGRERLALADKLITVTSRTTRYITATRWYERLARATATRFLNDSLRVQRDLPALLSGIQQRYDPSQLTGTAPEAGWLAAGTRVPHARLDGPDRELPLAKLCHGTRFTAVFVTRRVTTDVVQELAAQIGRLAPLGQLVTPIIIGREIAEDIPAIAGAQLYRDPFADLTGRLSDAHAGTLLIRPDGVVAASRVGIDADTALRFFDSDQWHPSQPHREIRNVA